jgi:hypothetical protein
MRSASRSITDRSAPTAAARSVLFITCIWNEWSKLVKMVGAGQKIDNLDDAGSASVVSSNTPRDLLELSQGHLSLVSCLHQTHRWYRLCSLLVLCWSWQPSCLQTKCTNGSLVPGCGCGPNETMAEVGAMKMLFSQPLSRTKVVVEMFK